MKIITRTDPFTGRTNFLSLDITEEQLRSWHNGELIQDAMPNLTADEREFVRIGIVSDSWKFLS
jgi:hypothetical protein